ncbi:MAG: hypothetical protein ABUL62_12805 [Myxococcales bacterium]|jgi:hypothetical protein
MVRITVSSGGKRTFRDQYERLLCEDLKILPLEPRPARPAHERDRRY